MKNLPPFPNIPIPGIPFPPFPFPPPFDIPNVPPLPDFPLTPFLFPPFPFLQSPPAWSVSYLLISQRKEGEEK
jgi:hypothetical protein